MTADRRKKQKADGELMYSALMTREEKEARIGRLVTEHSDLKKIIALLESELKDVGAEMEPVAYLLRRDPVRAFEKLKALPDTADLLTKCEKLVKAVNRSSDIKETLQNCD